MKISIAPCDKPRMFYSRTHDLTQLWHDTAMCECVTIMKSLSILISICYFFTSHNLLTPYALLFTMSNR